MPSIEVAEAMIKQALRHWQRTEDDLRLNIYPDGSMQLVLRSKDEKWLDWLSENHGWDNQVLRP